LKEDGFGLWRVADEEVSFRWNRMGSEIRLHTKEGGVIIGEIKGGNLKITLPGKKSMSFKRGGYRDEQSDEINFLRPCYHSL